MAGTAHLDIATSFQEPTGVVRLRGELDLDAVEAVVDACNGLLEQGASNLVVDTAEVSFLDSSGLRALMTGRQAALDAGASFAIEPVSAAVDRVLDITGTRTMLAG